MYKNLHKSNKKLEQKRRGCFGRLFLDFETIWDPHKTPKSHRKYVLILGLKKRGRTSPDLTPPHWDLEAWDCLPANAYD
jgi:hypothetical protein